MLATKTIAILTAAFAGLMMSGVTAAPTRTTKDLSARGWHWEDEPKNDGYAPHDSNNGHWTQPPRATKSVVVGRGGLRFDPENIVAEIGDVVEFHFTPKNHSVVQSSFWDPCAPIDDSAFYSGFFPVESGQSDKVFSITINHKEPIWFYCAQTTGSHCQNGMAGVINQKYDSDMTLSRYKINAEKKGGVSSVPPWVQGGEVKPNPNPLSGF